MNKKTILGLLTGAAIVAATTGSYAAWDTLTADAAVNVKFRKSVTVTNKLGTVTETTNLGGTPTYTTTMELTASDVPSGTTAEWTLVPEVKSGDTDVTGQVDVKFNDESSSKVDATLTAPDQITVTVTPHDDAVSDLADKDVSVKITATLGEKAASGE
ncbi:hypothetical protein [Holdemania massiliensis]|uniref:hypothetical protein n=1 Tax=Holdemania massiliensis TaxID=1468449 RepID=UPI001F05788B|nr:hypothetical protein [Holdemania massiliensis]MCH1942056.1 hypothetical protein [Holdemania massiliensis]